MPAGIQEHLCPGSLFTNQTSLRIGLQIGLHLRGYCCSGDFQVNGRYQRAEVICAKQKGQCFVTIIVALFLPQITVVGKKNYVHLSKDIFSTFKTQYENPYVLTK